VHCAAMGCFSGCAGITSNFQVLTRASVTVSGGIANDAAEGK
jgi:hypothetical protein